MRSFYSERTAEYTLVPAFADILNNLGESIPIYFWKTREGNKISESVHSSEIVRIVAFFARRPKIDNVSKSVVQGKINDQLYEFSKLAKEHNIPVFCGLPLTSNVFELNNKKILWFHVDPNFTDTESIFNVENGLIKQEYSTASNIESISANEIIDIVNNVSCNIPWVEAVNKMERLYRKPEDQFFFKPWWTRNWYYRPVYFLIREL